MRNKKGFTLIGVLVIAAIQIIAILTVLLLIYINGSKENKANEARGQAALNPQAETKKESQKTEVEIGFPSEKILTISAEAYCKNQGKDVQDYKMIGVHGSDAFLYDRRVFQEHPDYDYWANSLLLIHRIPPGTEVVVGLTYSDCIASGTALIPKQKVGAEAEEKDFSQGIQ